MPLCVMVLNICRFGCEEALDPTLTHPQTPKNGYPASAALEMSAGGELSFSTPLFGSHFCLEISKAAVKNFWFWKFPANRT